MLKLFFWYRSYTDAFRVPEIHFWSLYYNTFHIPGIYFTCIFISSSSVYTFISIEIFLYSFMFMYILIQVLLYRFVKYSKNKFLYKMCVCLSTSLLIALFWCGIKIIEKTILTHKTPNKNYRRRHFIFLLLSFEENKA